MALIRIGLDKFVFSGFVDQNIGFYEVVKRIFEMLGLDSSDFDLMRGKENSDCYNSKDFGIDIKLKRGYSFTIELQSTFFCCEHAFDLLRALYLELADLTGLQLSLNEMHVAQDYTGIGPTDFFKGGFENPSYKKCFNVLYDPLLVDKNGESSKTFYLRDPSAKGSDWSISFYDKTKDLQDKKSKASIFKNNYYRDLGYFDKQVMRIELKLNSRPLRLHFDNLFTAGSEDEFCKKALSTFYRKRKIYKLRKGETFDKKHPERFKKYKLWHQIFDNEYSPAANKSNNDLLFLETLTEQELVGRLSNLFSKYSGTLTVKMIEEVLVKAKEKKEERFRRKGETTERRNNVLENFSKSNDSVLFKTKDGKHVANRRLESFFQTISNKK